MNNSLKEKIDEISLMLVMTSEGDSMGIGLVLDLCQELAELAATKDGNEKLVSAVAYLKSSQESPNVFTLIGEFVSQYNRHLEDSTPFNFPNSSDNNSGSSEELRGSRPPLDQSLLTEYIETHTLLLEEFESSLLDHQNSGNDPGELHITIKRYLHNLKGDSGSIGLNDVEKVCHSLEDMLEEADVSLLITELLLFKQWLQQYLSACANGEVPPSDSADNFLKGIKSLKAPEIKIGPSPSAEIESSKVNDTKENTDEYSLTGERDILLEFTAEAEEHLNNVESIILEAEGTYSKDAVDTIFRGVHSIKGGSAYFNLEEMTKCSHILENFLSEVRDGKRELDNNLTGLLLKYIDLQKGVLSRAREAAAKNGIIKRSQDSVNLLINLENYKQGKGNLVAASTSPVQVTPVNSAESSAEVSKTDKLNLKNFVKVDTARLDLLIDSIGEMVIYSSMLIRQCRELLDKNESVMDTTHRVEKFSRDLQDIGMSMRLVPIKGLFQKMSRLVWDTSKKLGKEIVFSMEGEDTELDRNLIDKLADPLMHMVRNSLDHGIEHSEDRLKLGKSAAGKILLSASHAGGSIHIKIQDDGKGLNPEKLIAKAIEKGIISESQKLTDSEAFQLIFAAGFSTAAAVTDISGRGVGMDVVRRNVESLRGRIHIDSTVNKGSVFTIEIPLTLAIIDGIQVLVGNETFIIPSLSIIEFLRPKSEMINHTLDQGETLHFRGKYLPVFRIAHLYGIKPRYRDTNDSTIIIVDNNNEQIALMVDDITGECSTIIKSLGGIFGEGKGVAGCAIMPHGDVALILDIRSLTQYARTEYKFQPPGAISSEELHV